MLDSLLTDIRFGVRMLRKSPLFTLTAVLCIAVGSGAVTTIYSALNAMVLRPLSGTGDSDRLVRIERKDPHGGDGVSLNLPWLSAMRERSRSFEGIVAWGKTSLVLQGGAEAGDEVYGNMVSGNLFPVLGVRPRLGRLFSIEDDQPSAAPTIVVSEGYWKSRLGGDSAAVGRDLLVNGTRFTLIGVAPAAFQGLDAPIRSDAWVPLALQHSFPNVRASLDDQATWLRAAARLRPGVSLATAQGEQTALGLALVEDFGETGPARSYSQLRLSPLTGLPPDATGPLAQFLALLLGAAAMVLVIASVNVAAMISARAVRRRREMAVRAALGAARSRLMRQLLTEILVLFTLGATGGVLVALGATRLLERLPIPTEVPIQLVLRPDFGVMAFALLVSLVTGLLVGLIPVRSALVADVGAWLRDGARESSGRRSVMGNLIVILQLAASLVLLLSAGLLGRGLLRAGAISPGFDASNVTTIQLDPEAWGYDEAHGRRFFQALGERVTALPGVTGVSATSILPLNYRSSGDEIELPAGGTPIPIQQAMVDPGYFEVLRIPLIAGRAIEARDGAGSERVAVINETMARQLWPEGGALGRSFRYHGQPVTVIGIARDARYASLTETTPPFGYFPLAQEWRSGRSLLVRSAQPPSTIVTALARAVHETDPTAPRAELLPLTESTGVARLPGRVATLVTGVLGLAGLLLSIAGLYGVLAYATSQRTREIGIRLALGAERRDVLRLVLAQGGRLIGIGLAVGLGLAAVATPLLRSLLFGLSPLDPATWLLMPSALGAIAVLATWLPARKAAATEPGVALRVE